MQELYETKNVNNFLNKMDERPYPFNQSAAIGAQALSPYSGLSEAEKDIVTKKHHKKFVCSK